MDTDMPHRGCEALASVVAHSAGIANILDAFLIDAVSREVDPGADRPACTADSCSDEGPWRDRWSN